LRLLKWLDGLSWLCRLSGLALDAGSSTANARSDARGSLEWWLVGCAQQSAAIAGRVIDELPLVVVAFLVELPDRLVFARAGHAYNRAAAEYLLS